MHQSMESSSELFIFVHTHTCIYIYIPLNYSGAGFVVVPGARGPFVLVAE